MSVQKKNVFWQNYKTIRKYAFQNRHELLLLIMRRVEALMHLEYYKKKTVPETETLRALDYRLISQLEISRCQPKQYDRRVQTEITNKALLSYKPETEKKKRNNIPYGGSNVLNSIDVLFLV